MRINKQVMGRAAVGVLVAGLSIGAGGCAMGTPLASSPPAHITEREETPMPSPAPTPVPLPEGFLRVAELIPDLVQEIRYASDNNFVGAPVDGYGAPVAILSVPAAQALAAVADELRPQGMTLCVYDAYRPARAVAHFVRWAQDLEDLRMQEAFYPAVDKRDLFKKGYIAHRSGHSRGSTVDLTILTAEGQPLDMGSDFDLFDPRSAHGAKGLTREQTQHRAFLREVMERNGFRAYGAEWWHYTLVEEPYPETYFDFPIL